MCLTLNTLLCEQVARQLKKKSVHNISLFCKNLHRCQSPAGCVHAKHTDLVSLKEAEDVLDSGVVWEALHPDQSTRLRQHRGGCRGCGRCRRVGLCCYCCRHCSRWGCEVAHGGGRNWGAAERQNVCVCVFVTKYKKLEM